MDEVAAALSTERCLFPATRLLGVDEALGHGKVLLVRPTAVPWPARTSVRLRVVSTEHDWQVYERQRAAVEAGFAVDEVAARAMVQRVRERGRSLDLNLYLAEDRGQVVGAVGRFRLAPPGSGWARLQEIDVFPPWRGRGYGDALLAAVLDLLAAEGSEAVVIGADEDDWPLSWYRRRGCHDVARVLLSR